MAFSEPFVNRRQQYVALIAQERGSWRRAAPTISLETSAAMVAALICAISLAAQRQSNLPISEACGLAGTVV
jgi:hypothetical protein